MKASREPLVMSVLLLLAAGPAGAAIVKGPMLQDVRPDAITVVVETDDGAACQVEWDDDFGRSAPLPGTPLPGAGQHAEGSLAGLEPSTCYPYRVRCGDAVSPAGSFCTAPAVDEPFRFVVLGDTRTQHDRHAEVVAAVAAEGVDFYINTGDLVSDGGNPDHWQIFFDIEAELLRNLPFYPVVGNHDDVDGEIPIYSRLFAIPPGSGSEHYYAFDYGNTRFLALDNQAAALARPEDGSEQARWLEAELARIEADPAVRHVFVLVHGNMYSADDGRSGDEGLRAWRDRFLQAGVDAVYSGHDHHYARGLADNGLPFAVAGGGGAPLYDLREGFETAGEPIEVAVWGWLPEPGDKPFTLLWTRKVHHYILIEIAGDHVSACTKEVPAGSADPGVAFDCWEWGAEEDPDPDPDPEDPGKKGGGCITGGTASASLALLLCLAALGCLIRRRRG